MVDLVNDLDEITRLESGEQLLHKKKFIIQDVVREVFETLSKKAIEKNIQCSIKKGCEQPVEVFADKEKIFRVLINLVDNAIKYGRPEVLLQPAFIKQMISMYWLKFQIMALV